MSSDVGVALTASSVPCAVREPGGVEVDSHEQPVFLTVTRDGGRHWVTEGTPLPTPSVEASEIVSATSPQQIWASTGSGPLWATRTEGTNWAAQAAPSPILQLAVGRTYLWALSCTSNSNVDCRLVLDRERLPDGPWMRLPLPKLVSDPYPELVAPSSDVVVLHVAPFGDARGEVVSSVDAGLAWTRQTDPSRVDGPRLACGDFAAAGPRDWWLLCWLPGGMNRSANALRRTTDGGHTWTIVSAERSVRSPAHAIPSVDSVSLAAGSPTRLWFVGSVGGLAESADGGRSWRTLPLNIDGAATSFDVLSSTHAWLLALGQGLWRTTDGSHWRVIGHPYL